MSVIDKEGLRKVIASLTDLSMNATRWDLDPEAFVSDQDRAAVILKVFRMGHGVDVDEHRPVFDAPGYPANQLVITEMGERRFTITVRAEAYDKSVEAAEILDSIRTRIRSEASTEALNALSIALITTHDAIAVAYKVDERVVNTAIADFEFSGVASFVSDTNAPFILTVNGNNVVPGVIS